MCPNPIVGSALRLTTTSTRTHNAASAWNGTHVGVVYEEDTASGGVFFALLNADGTRAKSPDVQIESQPTKPIQYPDITWNGSEFGVTWLRSNGVMFRRLGPDGTPKAAAVNLHIAGNISLPQNPPRISWSPVYGGYAVATPSSGGVYFQRIGTDGTAPDPVNITPTGSAYSRPGMAISPTGEWGISVTNNASIKLAFYNPDGSKTKPVSVLDPSSAYYSLPNDLLHDGSTWVTTWFRNDGNVMVNRGAAPNVPLSVVNKTLSGPPPPRTRVRSILSSAGTYELVELRQSLIRLYRFSLAQTGPTSLTALTAETLVLPTPNGVSLDAATAGPGKLLILWSDDRWGAEELYAAPVDLQSCP